MGEWSRRMLVGFAVSAAIWFPGAALAQGTPATPEAEGQLKLTPAQRDLIYASISKQTHKSTASPDTWAPRVGANVPDTVELEAMPATIVEIVPQVRGMSVGFVASQVLIVRADSREIVEIITQKA